MYILNLKKLRIYSFRYIDMGVYVPGNRIYEIKVPISIYTYIQYLICSNLYFAIFKKQYFASLYFRDLNE